MTKHRTDILFSFKTGKSNTSHTLLCCAVYFNTVENHYKIKRTNTF